MTTDPYADAGSATFGPGGQAPVAPGYGISDPFPAPNGHGASATGTSDGTSGSPSGTEQTVGTAKDQASEVKDTATDAAQRVAGTAKDEAGNVVGEAKAQASNLLDQVKGEAGSQAGTQQQRLAGLVGSYAKELGSMASGSKESGALTDLAHQASRRAGEAAHWLENHEPAELLDEVRRFARRRPGAFLLSALAAGVLVGRVTRGAVDEARPDHDDTTDRADAPAPAYDGYSSVAQDPYARTAAVYDEPAAGYNGPLTGYAGDARVPGADLGTPVDGAPYGTVPGDVVR